MENIASVSVTEVIKTKHLQLTEEYSFIWTVKTIHSFITYGGILLHPEKLCYPNSCPFRLGLKIRGNDYVSVFLYRCTQPENKHYRVEMSILDQNNEKYETKLIFPTDEPILQSHRLISVKVLLDTPGLLLNNELRIACLLSLPLNRDKEILELQQSKNLLLQGFNKLYEDEKYSDFKLIVESKEFNVHRAVLAARSPVFEAMFDSKMIEAEDKKAVIENFEPELIKKMLRFMYIGEILNEDLDEHMLAVADMYQIETLKLRCEKELAKKSTIDNIYDILKLADQNNATILKKKAVEFFDKNIKQLMSAENFRSSVDSLPANLKTDIICICALNR